MAAFNRQKYIKSSWPIQKTNKTISLFLNSPLNSRSMNRGMVGNLSCQKPRRVNLFVLPKNAFWFYFVPPCATNTMTLMYVVCLFGQMRCNHLDHIAVDFCQVALVQWCSYAHFLHYVHFWVSHTNRSILYLLVSL